MEQIRKDFEEWLMSKGYNAHQISKRNDDTYLLSTTHADWQTWKAAHAKYVKKEVQLVNGRIPAGQECPFTSTCFIKAENMCEHEGISRVVAFSCGAARAYDISRLREAKND